MEQLLFDTIRDLVSDLVNRRFSELAADGRAGRLSAEELLWAIDRYGRTLVPLPDDAAHSIDIYPIGSDSMKWHLDVPLWTSEEGESDLTLSLVATHEGDKYRLEVNDLHVL